MRLLYDASTTLTPSAGVGRYTLELLRALLEVWPRAGPPPTVWMNSLRHAPERRRHGFLRRAHVEKRVRLVRTRLPGPLLLAGWEWISWPPGEALVGCPADVMHCPATYIVPTREAARVVSVHDLHTLRHPAHGAPLGGAYLAGMLPDRLPEVEAVIVPSAAVRGETMDHIPRLSPDRIHIIPDGVDLGRFRAPPPEAVAAVLRRRAIRPPYVLTVGTLEPRKNHLRLFRAMATWHRQAAPGETVPLLVGVGRPGWGGVAVPELCRRAGLDPRCVRWISDADDADLTALYAGARVVALPSLWEGFGLPALEAMGFAKPLVVGDKGGMPEVVGDTAVLVDPYDVGAIRNRIAELVRAPDERLDAMGHHAAARARLFTWKETARRTLEVYREAARRRR